MSETDPGAALAGTPTDQEVLARERQFRPDGARPMRRDTDGRAGSLTAADGAAAALAILRAARPGEFYEAL
jgi:hypothetical protein